MTARPRTPSCPPPCPRCAPSVARRDAQMAEIAAYVVHVSEIATELSGRLAALLAAHGAGDLDALRAELDATAAHFHHRTRRLH